MLSDCHSLRSFLNISLVLYLRTHIIYACLFLLMQDKSVAVIAPLAQPSEEELNPFLIFPQPEENFKVD